MKRIRHGWLLVGILVLFCAVSVGAESKNGSITIILQDTEQKSICEEVSFGLVKIADWENDQYVWRDAYAGIGWNLNEDRTAQELEQLIRILEKCKKNPEWSVTTTKNGIARLENIPEGLYFLYPENLKDYETVASSIVSVPSYEEREGERCYDIEVFSKYSANIITEERITQDVPTGVDFHEERYGMLAAGTLLMSMLIFWKKKRDRKET